jgi:hypothetical protein
MIFSTSAIFKSLIDDDQNAEDVIKEILNIYQKEKNLQTTLFNCLPSNWTQKTTLVQSVARSTALSAIPIEAISYRRGLRCMQASWNKWPPLKKLADVSSYNLSKSARNVALGAFSSKYEDEKER